MTAQEALRWAVATLTGAGIKEPRLDGEVLLAHTLGLTRAQLYARLDWQLNPEDGRRYEALIARRAEHEPLAYIVGHREFYGLDFLVDRRVLIPRPETELLVERAIEMARARSLNLMADVGTGCGAIAVSLAIHLPGATLYALDASPDALAVAEANCRRHGVKGRVHLLCGDLLLPLPRPVDLIVANLPYVRRGELSSLPRDIRDYEPLAALDGGEDGLEAIRRLLAQARGYLRPRGAILLEIGATQGAAVAGLASQCFPTTRVNVIQDYAGLDRVVVIEASS
ncbi:MAG: peptide chain release factor N(5)-glutamine methyltransferase [Anaerolineae bacterium]